MALDNPVVVIAGTLAGAAAAAVVGAPIAAGVALFFEAETFPNDFEERAHMALAQKEAADKKAADDAQAHENQLFEGFSPEDGIITDDFPNRFGDAIVS